MACLNSRETNQSLKYVRNSLLKNTLAMIDRDLRQPIYSEVAFIWEACDGKLFKSTIAFELKVKKKKKKLKASKLQKCAVAHGMHLIPV